MTPQKILKAKCKLCNGLMESKRGGDWQSCKCGKSYIDRNRWKPDTIRMSGEAKFISFE